MTGPFVADAPPVADANAVLTLSADLAAWLAQGRDVAARVRLGEPFTVAGGERDSFDELVELLQVLDRAACDDARRAA